MPFQIVKTSAHCYGVKNKDTGKMYSKKCMTKDNAISQLKILEHYRKKEEGG